MKVSYNWLSRYVSHGLTASELSEMLTMSGLEVDEVETIGSSLDGVVVGHVLETRRHPNADRLTLCDVDLGDGAPVQIVCGAPNVAAGQKVPVATVGTTLLMPSRQNPSVREPVTLQKAKLRGEVSMGMICAEDELGLSDNHEGIMVLDDDATPGLPFAEYLLSRGIEVSDTVLDVAITPNRPDAVSHIGMARDIAALTAQVLTLPEVFVPEPGGPASEQAAVEILAPDACRRYVALLVRGVRIQESPQWLKQRLTAVGLRPRNNVVDVTNFVMYECGQPLHAFDFDQIAGRKIVVRLSEGNEPFRTLDSRDWILPDGTLLICDAERPVAIAGVMGGENSEVTDSTVNVLIESAYFDPSTIRRASKKLGIQTDSSYRFERGVDPQGQVWAAARAAQLIQELAGGEIVPGMIDNHPNPVPVRHAILRPSRLKQVLGLEIPDEEVRQLLKAIGFEVTEQNALEVIAEHALEGRISTADATEPTLHCTIPSWRPDIEREIDIIEEVARLHGYHRIPEPAHSKIPNKVPQSSPGEELRDKIGMLLKGLGFREIYTNSMLRKEMAERFNQDVLGVDTAHERVVETLNPISQEMAALRPSLLPGLLQVMGFNQNHGRRTLRFFEFGHVYRRTDRRDTLVPGYVEYESLIIGMSGLIDDAGWDTKERNCDFFDLKGAVESVLRALRLPAVDFVPEYSGTEVTSYHVNVRSNGTRIGVVARVSDETTELFDLKTPVYFASFDWELVTELAAPLMAVRFTPISRFPAVERDIAVVVSRDEAVGPMVETIRLTGGSLLRDVSVFDLYQGEGIDADKKSVAFSLRFGADRTLQDAEVDRLIAAIVEALEKTHGAVLRR